MRKVLGTVFGFLIIIASCLGAIYCVVMYGWVPGITMIGEAIQQDPVPSSDVAWGVVRCAFAQVWVLMVFPGWLLGIGLIAMSHTRTRSIPERFSDLLD